MTDIARLESLRKTSDGPVPALDGKRVLAVLAPLGLAERSHDRPDAHSGDRRPRVALARALVTEPAVIFADMVTHDPVAASYADTVVSRGSMS